MVSRVHIGGLTLRKKRAKFSSETRAKEETTGDEVKGLQDEEKGRRESSK